MTALSPEIFERVSPEICGVSSKDIINFIGALCNPPQGQETHSFMLLRHKKVLAEGYFSPFAPETPNVVYSISKAFTAMAIGWLREEGKLNINDKIAAYFPEYQVHPSVEQLTVKHLLMMGTGQAGKSLIQSIPSELNSDIAEFLMTPVEVAPGTEFRYQNRVTYILAALATKLSGEDLMDYLNKKVFSPMGIEKPYAVRDRYGICIGYSGLRLRLEELAAFGVMLSDNGRWNGKQILPHGWAEEQLRCQIGKASAEKGDWEQGYCYQLWRGRYNTSRLCGAYGQMCVMMPDYDAVFVTNSGYYADIQYILESFYNKIMLKMSPTPLKEDKLSTELLAKMTNGLQLHSLYSTRSPLEMELESKDIAIQNSSAHLRLMFDGDKVSIIIKRDDKKDITFSAGFKKSEITPASYGDISELDSAENAEWSAAAYWKSLSELCITARLIPTPVVMTLDISLKDGIPQADCIVRRGNNL